VTRTRSGRAFGSLAALAIVAGLASACGGSSAADTGSVQSSPSSPSSAGTERPTAKPSGSLPPEAVATQGGKYYAVFLAVAGDAKDPALAEAQDRAKAIGYQGGVGDVNCTPGARTALNLNASADYTAYSIFFATAAQAQSFVNSYSGKIVGTAYITAGCLD
jgi:hypothetical protein